MRFLDEQGVQPCGHKAREKGILIKVFASCQSTEIPTEIYFSVSVLHNDRNTGVMKIKKQSSRKLTETQKTDFVDPSLLCCSSKTIEKPCTLPPDYTWSKKRRVHLIRGKVGDRIAWGYIMLTDDELTIQTFQQQLQAGRLQLTDVDNYSKLLASGLGELPPKDIEEKINEEYPN